MDTLQEARTFVEHLDGDGPPGLYERNAQRAIALALVAIAETLNSIDSNIDAIREIASYTEAGDKRLEELRAADLSF